MSEDSNIKLMLKKFQLEDEDLVVIKKSKKLLEPYIGELVSEFYNWLENFEEYKIFFEKEDEKLFKIKKLQEKYWKELLEAQIDDSWLKSRKHVGSVHAHIKLPNDIYFAGVTLAVAFWAKKIESLENKIKNSAQVKEAINKLILFDCYVVINEISEIHKQKIQQNAKALIEMSTPVTPIWEGILLLPLLGYIDSTRTQDIMNKSLNEISRSRAKVFVMDISGVGAMDTAVANQLIKITKATQLMGCEAIISGVSPAIARTLVELGVNIDEVRTTASLRDSFEWALKTINYKSKHDDD